MIAVEEEAIAAAAAVGDDPDPLLFLEAPPMESEESMATFGVIDCWD
jgi:hypothetical protein